MLRATMDKIVTKFDELVYNKQCPRCDTLNVFRSSSLFFRIKSKSLTCSECNLKFCVRCQRATDETGAHDPGADRQCNVLIAARVSLYFLILYLLFTKLHTSFAYSLVYWGIIFITGLFQLLGTVCLILGGIPTGHGKLAGGVLLFSYLILYNVRMAHDLQYMVQFQVCSTLCIPLLLFGTVITAIITGTFWACLAIILGGIGGCLGIIIGPFYCIYYVLYYVIF